MYRFFRKLYMYISTTVPCCGKLCHRNEFWLEYWKSQWRLECYTLVMVVFAPQRFAVKSNSHTAFSKSCVSLCIHMFAMQCYWCTTFRGGNLCLCADCGCSQKSSACSHIIRLVSMTNCVLLYNTFVSKNNCCLCTGHRLSQDQLFVILFVPKTICVVDMLLSPSITCHAITMIFPLYLFVCLLLRYHWSILCNGTTNHHENLWQQIDKVKPHVLYHIETKKYICINTVKTCFAQ